jgi:hypothetical protein
MHIVGINMALKCAWLGPEGDTLNVIAHELRELAGTTVNYANAAVVSLDRAAAQGPLYNGQRACPARPACQKGDEEHCAHRERACSGGDIAGRHLL